MKEIKKEIFFWIVSFFIFLPAIALIYSDKDLASSLGSVDIQHWTLKNSAGEILEADTSLVQDLGRSKHIIDKYWVFEKNLNARTFDSYHQPSFVFGRVGDSEKLVVNQCLVGTTGFKNDKIMSGWWSHLGFYEINKNCLKLDNNLIQIHVASLGGPSYGVFGGPVGIGEYQVLKRKIEYNNFLRYFVIFIYGFCLIAIGIYYLYVYFSIPEKKYYGYFGVLSNSIGIYLIMTSLVLHQYFEGVQELFLINIFFSISTTGLIYLFFKERFGLPLSKAIKVYLFLSLVLFTLALLNTLKHDLESVFTMYKIWYAVFLLSFFYFYIQLLRTRKTIRYENYWRYVISVTTFLICVFVDIYTTGTGKSFPYITQYGFMFFASVVALSLAKEYAEAFLHVEAQVGERTKDLTTALEQLRGLEKMKERFFANVSHDLKTPITIALGAIEDAKNQFTNVIGRVLEPADRSLKRLQDMVMGILDTVKAESGTLQLDWKSVKISDFMQNIVEPYRSLCAREGVQLKYSFTGFEGLYVPLDPSKMERVIENLLSNAFKFTKKTTRPKKIIEVSIQTDQSKLYVYIDDSGIGIPQGEHEKVFERYFQSSRTNLKEHGGSGIGLSFVSEMIALHNGKVYASDSPQGGTRFTLELPLSQSVENIQSYRIEETGEKVLRGSLDVEYPPTRPANINQAFSTILVAEDNPEVAQIVYSTLQGKYNIFFGENGKRAFQLLSEHSFDCIISDIQMPEMMGDELVEKIRRETTWKSIPIIMLSSHGDDDTIVKLLKLGANDYVQKPFRREILLSRIQAQISAYKGTTWNTKLEKLQELGQLVSGIGHQGKNRIGRVGSNYPLLVKMAKDLAKKYEISNPEEAQKISTKIDIVGDLIDKGYRQTVDLFKAIDRYASGSDKKTMIMIDEIVMDTITLLEEKIQLKGVNVQTSIPKDLAFEGYNEFREAILNIVSNSIDALEERGGKVEIKAEDHGHDILLSIKDNGSGIPKENLQRVFDPFFTSKKVGQGTGLGLYLARDAVELKNRGKLTIESPGPGQGTVVHIRVPKVVPEIDQQRLTMHNVEV